ncbi:AAA family ATPase [Synechococcus sp. CS-1324]|uniref:bifunctional aminoglycoside phosphotransferase/ATP-binding protein n=1 Tax=Synechococcus sp. CS-1324 TaxID=2847980 RepID=UPI000DAFB07F|nr:bifunctional aminoglycoside phosphotransferase/ATP-binding protein [Synechococcus sp. CS-1324]MCT0229376.1 AAA family ATPase [Synechococcus sp. CS-1324]PZV06104.1 MAG: hypothetical protein DCF23_01040 [Cyanobium sp.]
MSEGAADASLDALIAALSLPSAYPAADWEGVAPEQRRVEVIQTHISVVFLTPQRAYKLKKPLRLWDLLDYSSPELRLHWCEEEVRLNRRLAPDLYLGVSQLIGPRGPEPVVVMRRFAAADTLQARLAAGQVGPETLRAVGSRIAAFHRQHLLTAARSTSLLKDFSRVLHSNLRSTRSCVPALVPASVHRQLDHLLALALRRQRHLLRQRLGAGWAVDGHGDLRLEHVLLLEPIAVVDGVEFNASLRRIDAGSDLAFLAMELQAAGHSELIEPLLEGYGRAIEPAVFALFCAYRAHVRAKVAAATCLEPEIPAAQRQQAARMAQAQLSLALAYAGSGQTPPALLLLRGSSGSGKSQLARELAPWLLADHLQSDRIRKQLHGLAPLARTVGAERDQLYGAAAHQRTEAALLAAAAASLRQGRTVLLDATHLARSSRARAVALAGELAVPWLILDLHTPQAVIEARLEQRYRRNDDPSDADAVIQAAQRLATDPLLPQEAERTLTVPADLPGQTEAEGPRVAALLIEIWSRLIEPAGR